MRVAESFPCLLDAIAFPQPFSRGARHGTEMPLRSSAPWSGESPGMITPHSRGAEFRLLCVISCPLGRTARWEVKLLIEVVVISTFYGRDDCVHPIVLSLIRPISPFQLGDFIPYP